MDHPTWNDNVYDVYVRSSSTDEWAIFVDQINKDATAEAIEEALKKGYSEDNIAICYHRWVIWNIKKFIKIEIGE